MEYKDKNTAFRVYNNGFAICHIMVYYKGLLIDADGVSLGRLSTKVASILTGKEKPTFTQHIDCGDYVVIVNAEKVKITGNKLRDKKYYRQNCEICK